MIESSDIETVYKDKFNPDIVVYLIDTWPSAGKWVCKYSIRDQLFVRPLSWFQQNYELV